MVGRKNCGWVRKKNDIKERMQRSKKEAHKAVREEGSKLS